MTISAADLADRPGPRYRAIADAFGEAVDDGRLAAGERLPTHRDLAWSLGVTVGTVTRAYRELDRRGLVRGEVGRGTFVRGPSPVPHEVAALSAGDGLIEMSLNLPSRAGGPDLAAVLRDLAGDPATVGLLGYQYHAGAPAHRAAGADWLARGGVEAPAARVLVTAGAQHGVVVALSALVRPGDRVGVEALTYPGMRVAAQMLGLRLEPLAMDGEGVLPEAFAAACRAGIMAFYLMPTLQNPTAAVMPEVRRREILGIADAHGATIIEDDLFGRLCPDSPPPLAALAPERVIHVTGLSKTLAPGLRIGYLAVPDRHFEAAVTAVRGTCWMAPPLMAAIAARWIADGTAERVLAARRTEGAARLELARRVLAGQDFATAGGSMHLWLRLPAGWTAPDFVHEARREGVRVAGHGPFAVGPDPEGEFARLCLGPPVDQAELEQGLDRLAAILVRGPATDLSLV